MKNIFNYIDMLNNISSFLFSPRKMKRCIWGQNVSGVALQLKTWQLVSAHLGANSIILGKSFQLSRIEM